MTEGTQRVGGISNKTRLTDPLTARLAHLTYIRLNSPHSIRETIAVQRPMKCMGVDPRANDQIAIEVRLDVRDEGATDEGEGEERGQVRRGRRVDGDGRRGKV